MHEKIITAASIVRYANSSRLEYELFIKYWNSRSGLTTFRNELESIIENLERNYVKN